MLTDQPHHAPGRADGGLGDFGARGGRRVGQQVAFFAGFLPEQAFGFGFPIDADSDPLHQRSVAGWLHTVSGGAFFLTLAFYSLDHFPSSGAEKREVAPHESERNFVYRASGTVRSKCSPRVRERSSRLGSAPSSSACRRRRT